MNSKADVQDFLCQKKIAVAGVSRKSGKFGSVIYRELKSRGYQVLAVNPNTDRINGDSCYKSLTKLPEPADAALIVVPKKETEKVVRDAHDAGIKRIWIQQGSESAGALDFCREKGLQVVSGECIFMFAEPVASFHRFHRWIWKLLGKLPS
jgi:predicted CoA-binding protein